MGRSTQHESAGPTDPELAGQPRPSIWRGSALRHFATALTSCPRLEGLESRVRNGQRVMQHRAARVARKRGRRARRSTQPTKSSDVGRHQTPLFQLTDNLQPMNKERWTGCRNGTESRHDRIHLGSCSWLGSEERAPSPSLPLQNTLVTFLLGELIITAGHNCSRRAIPHERSMAPCQQLAAVGCVFGRCGDGLVVRTSSAHQPVEFCKQPQRCGKHMEFH